MSGLLADARAEYRSLRTLAEKALAQVDDAVLHHRLDDEANSLATIVRHVSGNLRSRWTDVLTTDGEKPDRNRDSEFEDGTSTRAEMMARWSAAWDVVFASLDGMSDADLDRTITIRGEPHTVRRALVRSLTHTAQHVGQAIQLCKHHAGRGWSTLSIARGASATFRPPVA